MRFRVSLHVERIVFDRAPLEIETRKLAQRVATRMRGRIRRSAARSKPGQAPKGKTGTLRRSIGYRKLKAPRLGYHVGPRKGGARSRDGFFARFLRFGTKHGLAPRRLVDDTMAAERGYIERAIAAAARSGLKGSR